MKRFFIVFLFSLFGSYLFSQTTGSITLSGNVPGILSINVIPDPSASNLDLTIVASNILIGTITERSNKKAGYVVTLESSNAKSSGTTNAFFKSSDPLNSDSLDYTITYDGTPVNLVGGQATISDISSKTTSSGTAKEARISYDGNTNFLFEDTYTDYLTFTIIAK